MMRKEMCQNCKFYFAEEETKRGSTDDCELHPDDYESECRRYPPVRGEADYYGKMTDDHDVARDYFAHPIVNCKAWCGEWSGRA